ncbi:MAG: glycosyltransferase family 4 protein [archaeon]
MDTLKICFVSRNYGSVIHGPSIYGNNLINGIIKKGHEVHIITPDNTATSNKAKIIYVKKPIDLKHATWIQLSSIFSKKIERLSKIEKFDIVHFLNSLEVMRYNGKINNVLTTIQGYHFAESTLNPFHYTNRYPIDWYLRYPYYNIGRLFEIKGLRKMKHIITPSEYIKKSLIKNYDLSESKITTVYYGIKQNKEHTLRKKFNYNVILVGNNFQTKGISTLIRVAKSLKKEFPMAKYTIVGDDKRVLPYMKKLTEKEGVAEKFIFTGHVPNTELKEKYKEADIFILPSTIEGFGMVFLEAMNYGLPVIGSNVGGIPEIIDDGKNGFLVDPENPKEIAEKIRIIFEDEALRNKISENAYKRVGDFPLSKMVDETIKVYKNLT